MITILPFSLADPVSGATLDGKVTVTDQSILLSFNGYGEMTAQAGYGNPIWMEYYQGDLLVHVADDINHEEHKTINMNGALEVLYEGDDT